MAAAVAAAMPLRSPGKEDGHIKERHVNSPTSILDVDTVEVEEKTMPSITICNLDCVDWDPAESSLMEFSESVMLGIVTTAMLFKADSVDELIPWGEWNDGVDVAVQFAYDPRDSQIGESLSVHEAARVNSWSSIQGDAGPDDLVVVELEIKKRRYWKRGDGTRRHGRPPDLTFPAPRVPPLTPPATMNAYLLEPDEGVACPEVMLKGLHRTSILYFARSLRHRKCSPSTTKRGTRKSPDLYEPTFANPFRPTTRGLIAFPSSLAPPLGGQ